MANMSDVFTMGQELCRQGQQLNDAFQNAYQGIQNVSRRNMRTMQPQQTVTQYPNYAPENMQFIAQPQVMGQEQMPPSFIPKPGFWNENYGR